MSGGGVARWSWLSPALIISGALILIALERWRPYDARQRLLRPGLWVDLIGYTIVQSYLLGLLISHLIAALDHVTGLSRLHLVSAWALPAQVGFFLATHDLYIYLFHRLQHRSSLLWRIHEAHHATTDVDWLSGSRSHALEILINQTIEFAAILLLGGAPEVALIKVTLDALWGMYIHSNIDVRSGRLQWIVNGPEMHRWHHAVELREGANFSTKLAIWDFLFGTAYRPARKPDGYGLWGNARFPSSFLAQQLQAFRRRPSEPAAGGEVSCQPDDKARLLGARAAA
jgi:sterol desaturase/sphingolipid hydroxylase (fatty acid hydroxylase superfamily)